jgi:uncharacterized protein (TIGR03435 family)
VASGVNIALVTDPLTSELGRPVIDKTGLTGRFDIKLKIRMLVFWKCF